MTIDNKHVVALNYILHTDGENNEKVLVEKSDAENPLTFLYGVGMMIPKFEENIKGLTTGDKASFTILPAEGYGERNPDAVAQLHLDMFKESGIPPVGAILPLSDNNGNNFQAVVLEVTPDSIQLSDPTLQQAYGGDKEMSLFDFKRALRKDPRWQYTDNAKQEVSNSVLGVLRDFGFQG